MHPVDDEVKARSYDNSRRTAQSVETRGAILDAARTLMLERGYRATTIAEIARRSGVHVATIYELVGRKPVVLRELIEAAISGTGVAVGAEEREYVIELRRERDPRRKLEIYARATRQIHARLAPLLLALRDASTTEPEAAEVWREISARRAQNMRKLAGEIDDAGGLRTGMSIDDAADSIWVTNSAEVYTLLVDERGWSPERYERWLAESWCRLLLTDG